MFLRDASSSKAPAHTAAAVAYQPNLVYFLFLEGSQAKKNGA